MGPNDKVMPTNSVIEIVSIRFLTKSLIRITQEAQTQPRPHDHILALNTYKKT